MFTLYGDGRQTNCERVTRRELLRVGALALGGLSLSNVLSAKAAGGASLVKDKSVVLLYLQGGMSHIESFDPKMSAPVEYRAMHGEVQTSLPGVTFGSHLPGLAAMADRMAIVRCFRHGHTIHEKAAFQVLAGGNPSDSNMAAVFAMLAGSNSPRTGIPNSTLIMPPAVGKEYQDLGNRFTKFITNLGTLPDAYRPFDPSVGGELMQSMKLRIPETRLDDRRSLLGELDRLKRTFDGTDALRGSDRFEQQAFDIILGGMSRAFNLNKEKPELVARYDTSMFTVSDALARRRRYGAESAPVALGKQMLMARRLIEADCRFVTVTSDGWDMHGNPNNFTIDEGMPLLAPALDKAVTAFIEDLEDRGLTDKVLLVITGDFGRTPLIDVGGGRGHWGDLCTLAFVGGGLPMGQVIGQSDNRAAVPEGQVVTPANMLATIMGTLLDMSELRVTSGVPTDILRHLTTSEPIPQLM